MKKRLLFRLALSSIALVTFTLTTSAQTDKLTATILHLDSAFWNAYNNCDTAHFKDFMTDDIEFYHDKGGVTTDAKSLIEALNKNICGNPNSRLRREAVKGTVKVYPMANNNQIYGALITGEHDFFLAETGKPEYHSGRANFTQLWRLNNGEWKMTRILSYNHHEPEYINKRKVIEVPARKLDKLTGTFKSDQSGTVLVTRENKILVLTIGKDRYSLFPETETSFFTKERDLVFAFETDQEGKPTKISVREKNAVTDELTFVKK